MTPVNFNLIHCIFIVDDSLLIFTPADVFKVSGNTNGWMKPYGPIKFSDLDGDGFIDINFMTCNEKDREDEDSGCYLNFIYNIQNQKICTKLNEQNCRSICQAPQEFYFEWSYQGKGHIRQSIKSMIKVSKIQDLNGYDFVIKEHFKFKGIYTMG